jgi:hypothetical protein
VVVVVVDTAGMAGLVVVVCSVVVVLVGMSELPQPANTAVQPMSATPIRILKADFVSVMAYLLC